MVVWSRCFVLIIGRECPSGTAPTWSRHRCFRIYRNLFKFTRFSPKTYSAFVLPLLFWKTQYPTPRPLPPRYAVQAFPGLSSIHAHKYRAVRLAVSPPGETNAFRSTTRSTLRVGYSSVVRSRVRVGSPADLMHGYVNQKHAVQKTVQPRAQRRVRHENTYASGRSVRARYYIPRQGMCRRRQNSSCTYPLYYVHVCVVYK